MTILQDQLQETLGSAYVVERELGGGGMSRVFVARDTALDRQVVIKVLHPDLSASVSVDRFRREIMLAATLQHPHIVGILSAGETDGVPYFIMPYVEGESLRARIARGRMNVVEIVHVMRDIARALAYAHERGVVHRDIKPDNVLLSSGSACVADFGVAKALSSSRVIRSGPTEGTLTLFGTSLGTPGYMAPEQAAADPNSDQRADIYSFGVTAYEMITGAAPFRRNTPQATLAAQLTEVPPPIESLRADVPAALAALVMRCVERDADHRPQSAAEVLTALEDPAVISGAFASSTSPAMIARARTRRRLGWTLGIAAAAIAAVAGGFALRSRATPQTRTSGPTAVAVTPAAATPPSIAVLPLVNLARDTSDQYFADGMTEEITSKLSKVRGLRVASRTAAVSVRGQATSVADIGKQLGVTTLLEGTVQRDKKRVRLTARLVNVADGFTLWSDVYERDLKDVFALQDEISQAIVTALAPELQTNGTPAVTAAATAHDTAAATENPAAYNEYLLGRYFFAKRGEAALKSAIEHFKGAVKVDSSYALAYAGLADAYAVMPLYGTTPGREAWPLALAAANRAIAIDPNLAEGYAARGNVYAAMWQWRDAEADLRRAIALKPTIATAHQWLGETLDANGRLPEAVAELKRASELDPTSPITLGSYAIALGAARDSANAIATAQRAVALDPSLYATRFFLGTVQLYARHWSDGLRELEAASALSSGLVTVRGMLGYGYAMSGDTAHARQILADIQKTMKPGSAFAIGRIYLGLGDTSHALDWLMRAAREHDSLFASEPLASPIFDSVRGDPRFAAIVRQAGLDPRVASR